LISTQTVLQASAYEVNYEVHEPRFFDIPTVCTIAPDPNKDEYLSEYYIEHILKETKVAISEWEVQLQTKVIYKQDKPKWEINYIEIPLADQEKFDYKECDVFILFEAKPKDKKDWYSTIGESQYETGNTGRTNIIVYYAGIQVCVTKDAKYYYYNPCYSEKPRTATQIANVVRHEFGHALGLGHYISDDNDINLRWARGKAAAPSIMAIFSHEVASENKIQTIDIDKAYSLYGADGFLRNVTKPYLGFESFTTLKDKYVKDKSQTSYVIIFGNVTSELYREGSAVDFVLTKPGNLQEKFSTKIAPDAGFETAYPVDMSSLEGTYLLKANYQNYISKEISFEILANQDQSYNFTQKIPSWIKNNAKWWSEDKIADNDFVEGIKYLIKEEIIKVKPIQNTGTEDGRNIPEWIKTTAGWWANDQVPEDDFIRGMQYLVQNGIMSFN
jgi:hypothetical protein